MVSDNCVLHKSTKLIYLKDYFIELSQPHVTYKKANNTVVKFVEEDVQNIDLLKSGLRNHLRTIQYVYSVLFPKIFNRTNRFGINNKSHFDFIFKNWKDHKNNMAFPTPTGNRVAEQPTKKIVPESDITQQLQQQQQNEEILEAGKRTTESYVKRVAHPFNKKPEKNNEVLPLSLPPPSPALSAALPMAPSKFFTAAEPTAKSVMDARIAKIEAEKSSGFRNS